ncbi:hypothetical protein HAV15_004472 [Penicillium sp. str. |nr:hypothetical protein HAV15_004472 [Penicillium sp. str. \
MLTKQPTERSLSSHSAGEDNRKKFGMGKGSNKNGKSKEPTDDLSQMISRAQLHDPRTCEGK